MKMLKLLAYPTLLAASIAAAPVAADVDRATYAPAMVVENVSPADFATTVANLKEQLEADGWVILTEVNLGERLARRGVEIPEGLVLLGLTSGGQTIPLLRQDETRYISSMMPCGVSIYGLSDGRVIVSRANFAMMSEMMEPPVSDMMRERAAELDQTITRALAKD